MISVIAGIVELLAKWMVGNKNRWGWLVHLLSGFLWTYIALNNPKIAGGLLIIVVPSYFINVRNFIKWSKGIGNCNSWDS